MVDTEHAQPLHCVARGEIGDTTLVFLHGFGFGSFVWSRLQEDLSSAGASLAYDLPGHGSSVDSSGLGGAGRMAGAVSVDLANRGVTSAHFVGHSMGGAVATKIALRTPSMVASMTLLAPGGFGPEINHRLLHRFADASDEDTLRSALENMFGWNSNISDDTVAALVKSRENSGVCERLKTILGQILHRHESGLGQGMIGRRDIQQLTMPIKVLWGTQDRLVPTRQAHRLPPLMAAHVFEDTGHMLVEERPDEVAHLVRQNIKAAG